MSDQLLEDFNRAFPTVITLEDAMRLMLTMKHNLDECRKVARMFYEHHENRRNCSLFTSCKQCDAYEAMTKQ